MTGDVTTVGTVATLEDTTNVQSVVTSVVNGVPLSPTKYIPGLDPTGVTDSSAAIQAALDFWGGAGGGNLMIPAGTYKISNTIYVGDAEQFATTPAAGSSGTTQNCASTASWTAGGFPTGPGAFSMWTASETATVVTYTSRDDTHFYGCSSLVSGTYITAGSISDKNNISLVGEYGMSQSLSGFTALSAPGVILKWDGASGGIMIIVNGPVNGGGLANLYLDCNNSAAIGYYVRGHQTGVYENLFVTNYTQAGYYITGITGFPVLNNALTCLGNTIGCVFRNIGFQCSAPDSFGIFMDGDPGGGAIGSANFTYSLIDRVYCDLGDPGAGNVIYGLYHRFVDNVTIRKVDMTAPNPAGTIYAAAYDFTTTGANNCPESCILDDINPGLSVGQWVEYGTPNGGDINLVQNVRGGGAAPAPMPSVDWNRNISAAFDGGVSGYLPLSGGSLSGSFYAPYYVSPLNVVDATLTHGSVVSSVGSVTKGTTEWLANSSDANAAVSISANPFATGIGFGPGGATAQNAFLAYVGANTLKTGSTGQGILQSGSDTAGATAEAAQVFTSGTAAQLAQIVQDSMLYCTVTLAGTLTLTMGHTSSASDATPYSAVAVVAGSLISVRIPAGWYVKFTLVTATISTATLVTC